MKRMILSFLIILTAIGAVFLFSRYWWNTNIQCQSTFEKNFTPERYSRGVISVHLFSDHTGVANVVGKMTADGTVYEINREVGFTREVVDIQKGVFRIKKNYFKLLLGDNMPSRYNEDINLNTDSQNSDYMIIKKINKNTWLFTSPAVPVMMCVSE